AVVPSHGPPQCRIQRDRRTRSRTSFAGPSRSSPSVLQSPREPPTRWRSATFLIQRSPASRQKPFGSGDENGVVRVLGGGDLCKQPLICPPAHPLRFRRRRLLEMPVLAAELAIKAAQPVMPYFNRAAPL